MVVGRAEFIIAADKARLIAFAIHKYYGVTIVDVRKESSQSLAEIEFVMLPEIIFGCASGRERKRCTLHGQQCEQRGEFHRRTALDLIA